MLLKNLPTIDGKTLTLETLVPGEGRDLVRTVQPETIEADVVVHTLGQTGNFGALGTFEGVEIVLSDCTWPAPAKAILHR
jgi:hypothetical protein